MAAINPIQLQKHLKGVNYPATKQDLLERAKENKADKVVCDALERLPEKEYGRPTDVTEAISSMDK